MRVRVKPVTDIVTRLRARPHVCEAPCVRCKAADEIERLRQLNVELANQLNNKP